MPQSQLLFRRDGRFHVTAGEGREQIADLVRQCAELTTVVAGDYLFNLSETALWGAAARGAQSAQIIAELDAASAVPLPAGIATRIASIMSRWGRLRLVRYDGELLLAGDDPALIRQLELDPNQRDNEWVATINPDNVGRIKLAAMSLGWPITDPPSAPHQITPYRSTARLRPYQQQAVEAVMRGGSGLVLLPCGAGKTVVGVAVAARVGGMALVLTPSRTVSEQWQAAFKNTTTVGEENVRVHPRVIGGESVTIVTYHAATAGKIRAALVQHPWDLVIYDEVQSLPADVFRLAAGFQSARRIGLTATLVREDGREREIMALVGPALFDISWSELERQGWIAPARCIEVRIPYAPTPAERERYRLATLHRLLQRHRGEATIVAGTRVASLRRAGSSVGFPVLDGSSSAQDRADLYERFRNGDVPVLGLSRIGSVGIDLPNAGVLIQISGTFGSRQEEAQRLGRLLRPASGKTASFYQLVSVGTAEEGYAQRRQRFLVGQGYQYELLNAGDLPRPGTEDFVS
ncbi:MAG: helicase-associated domain-containing protein [Thermomicrobiales bacterium]|nr:helicase-associated domain-containing protein [Thermomicrobiales bacterium]